MITVRAFRPGDEAAVAALERLCFADPWSENAVKEAVAYGTVYYLAADGDTVIGYAGVKPVLDEGQIANIAVAPDRRGRGIGKTLLAALLDGARKAGLATVTLEVRPSNTAALALYRGAGFAETGRRRHFYTHPDEDAILMTCEVASCTF